MSMVHRTSRGAWGACRGGEGCSEPFHLPTSTQKLGQLPPEMQLELINMIDPPTQQDGQGRWWLNAEGLPHREHDLPAVIYHSGDLEWHRHGRLHRDFDRPAALSVRGTREWYRHGQRYRGRGKPAVITAEGTLYWYTPERGNAYVNYRLSATELDQLVARCTIFGYMPARLLVHMAERRERARRRTGI